MANVLTMKNKEINFDTAIKVYMGKDNACRCGCAGKYHYAGTKGFKQAIGRLITAYYNGNIRQIDDFGDCLNIAYGDEKKDQRNSRN